MQIAKTLAGFSGPKADDLRKAIGKKNREAMAKLKPEFVEGCRASGTAPDVIECAVGDQREERRLLVQPSHAACYALISYRTAWLKANYPAEYMAALISSVMDTKDKVPFFVNQAESMGIEILPPDVNLSDHEFVVVDGNIRFGLDAVKGVGYAAVEAIKAAREDGPFTSLWDFCERVDGRAVNKKAIEALIKCGAFGSTGATRRGMLDGAGVRPGRRPEGAARRADRPGLDLRPRRLRRRTTARVAVRRARRTRRSRSRSSSARELLAIEKESIGLFITEHPLKRVRDALRVKGDTLCSDVPRAPRRRVGEGRRHDLGVEEDQDALGLDGDVRDARRPRRPGRAARLREGDPGERARAAARPDRARARHRRPRRERQGLREGRRRDAVQPVRRRDRARARPGGGARGRPRAAPAAPARRRRPPAGVGDRRAQADLRRLPGRVRGRARGPHAHRPAQAALRRRVPGQRPQRGAQGRARPRARRGRAAGERADGRPDAVSAAPRGPPRAS